ncbi:MAG: L-threonine 3-dehydrogenase, partial [Nitrospirae bacterium]
MKALVKTAPGPGLTLQQMPDPNPGPSEVVVRVKATSLCGTDAHIYNWDEWAQSRIRPPRIIGHEMCGEVAELGPGVSSVAVGEYVAAESHFTCGVSFQCRTGQAHVCRNYRILGIDVDGSCAEFVVLPERVLWKTSRDIPPELACVQEPLGNALDAALAEDVSGQTVLITGCGPTGLFAAAVARV